MSVGYWSTDSVFGQRAADSTADREACEKHVAAVGAWCARRMWGLAFQVSPAFWLHVAHPQPHSACPPPSRTNMPASTHPHGQKRHASMHIESPSETPFKTLSVSATYHLLLLVCFCCDHMPALSTCTNATPLSLKHDIDTEFVATSISCCSTASSR